MHRSTLQQQYLQALGIQAWVLKDGSETREITDSAESTPVSDTDLVLKPIPAAKPEAAPGLESDNSVKSPDKTGQPGPEPAIKAEKTVSVTAQPASNRADVPVATPVEKAITPGKKPETEHPDGHGSELIQSISNCQACSSRVQRLNTLAGQGNPDASVFFISDAPSAEEDRSGHYLNESAQRLFQAMLASIDVASDYFYTGMVKCHSLQEFVVSNEDVQHCSAYLKEQVKQVNPRLIVLLGINPARALLETDQTFNQLHGKLHSLTIEDRDYPVLLSYHPAYLLRNPLYKRQALSDLLLIKQTLND